jgi:hypothetical protein
MGMIDRQFKTYIEKDPWAYIKNLQEQLHKALLDQQALSKQYEAEKLLLIEEIKSLKKQIEKP